jgi:hypothetical protein
VGLLLPDQLGFQCRDAVVEEAVVVAGAVEPFLQPR